ncbi:unnamed protein product [Blepharisma stoltei]|uniref:Uncharacterized protein n=1 Tax=Blepharisma stoltei TaxID=1481888 RepID=A0AAU9IR76_9CILI|nr:unnamed protein product [Blepharisma stoltei]
MKGDNKKQIFEEALLKEIEILCKNYSPLRSKNLKWECEGCRGYLLDKKFIKRKQVKLLIDDYGCMFVEIAAFTTQTYKVSDLLEKSVIRMNNNIFQGLKSIWSYINPSQGKLLSKNSYSKLQQIFADALYSRYNAKNLQIDLSVDFGKDSGIVFQEFYDSFFEMLNSAISSKDVKAYSDRLNEILLLLFNKSTPFLMKNRLSRTPDPRPSYSPWMLRNYPHYPPTPTLLYTRPSSRLVASFRAELSPCRSTFYS